LEIKGILKLNKKGEIGGIMENKNSNTSDDRFFIRAQWFLWGFVAGLWVAYFMLK